MTASVAVRAREFELSDMSRALYVWSHSVRAGDVGQQNPLCRSCAFDHLFRLLQLQFHMAPALWQVLPFGPVMKSAPDL